MSEQFEPGGPAWRAANEPIPFEHDGMVYPGFVAGWCGHRVAESEWRAGFRVCERCPEPESDDPAAVGGETVEQCRRCQRPFDPDDKDPSGAAQYGASPWCRGCVDRCHESTDAFHQCPVCAEEAPS